MGGGRFKYLDNNLTYDFLKVPTFSQHEIRIIEYIKEWAENNDVTIKSDEKQNIYLTKGVVEQNEYYPCFTAHMDSVQEEHLYYIENDLKLPLITTLNERGNTVVTCRGFGPGADDKCGILIILTLFAHLPVMKATLFVEEEIGMLGSIEMDNEFFNDVGYVIAFDSPGGKERAAHTCNGVPLFTKDFYINHMKSICDQFGYKTFFSEPYTDIIQIKYNIPIQCMNFGSGYYNAHSKTEYIVLEDVDNAVALGIALVKHLKYIKYDFDLKSYDVIDDGDFMLSLSGYTHFSNRKKEELTPIERAVKINTMLYELKIQKILEYITNSCFDYNLDVEEIFPHLFEIANTEK